MSISIDHDVLPMLARPIAVFDAGIGSYAAVAAIQRLLPQQDILYFADRASFPYGDKSRQDLLAILRRTLRYLDGFDPAAVLVASNAPSITVLDDLVGIIGPPVFGVRPPIAAALAITGPRAVAVLGVQSMVESPELRLYADTQAGERKAQVHLVNASPLVELVESGAFLFAPERTQAQVNAFFDALDQRYTDIAAFTLSSTHLPWLRTFIERARPGRPLFDPLDDAIAAVAPHAVPGTGAVLALVTENERYSAAEFGQMLDRLGVSLPLHKVTL
jgi:glutamate racemase